MGTGQVGVTEGGRVARNDTSPMVRVRAATSMASVLFSVPSNFTTTTASSRGHRVITMALQVVTDGRTWWHQFSHTV